ncbi:MAG: InlB B-repeat-containing protein [Clostridia bacterium]|nr:InlB B-repeat-containing protein [Clostridia bacterium]
MKVLKKVLSVLVVASIVFGSALSCPVGAIATDVSAQAVDQILDLSENPNTSSSDDVAQDDSILDISGDGAEGSSASSNADAQGEEDAQFNDVADEDKADDSRGASATIERIAAGIFPKSDGSGKLQFAAYVNITGSGFNRIRYRIDNNTADTISGWTYVEPGTYEYYDSEPFNYFISEEGYSVSEVTGNDYSIIIQTYNGNTLVDTFDDYGFRYIENNLKLKVNTASGSLINNSTIVASGPHGSFQDNCTKSTNMAFLYMQATRNHTYFSGLKFNGIYGGERGTGTKYVNSDGYYVSHNLSYWDIYKNTQTKEVTLYVHAIAPNRVDFNNNGATTAGTARAYYKWSNALQTTPYQDLECTSSFSGNKITPPTRTGYTFTGYYTSSTNQTDSTRAVSSDGTINSRLTQALSNAGYGNNITVYAGWTLNTLTINYHENGGTKATKGQTETIYYNSDSSWNTNDYGSSSVAFNTTPPAGYIATGNYLVGSASSTTKIGMNENMTAIELATKAGKAEAFKTGNITVDLYAEWKATNFTVTYNYSANGGTSATKTSASVMSGSAVDLSPTAAKSGWTFVGWNTSSAATTALSSYTMPSNNVTLYAIFKRTLTATFYSGINKAGKQTASVTIYNTATSGNVTAPSPSQTVWAFAGWTTSTAAASSTVIATNATITLTADATYYALWTGTHTLTYNANGGSGAPGVSSATGYYNSAGNQANGLHTVSSTVPTRTGYTFGGWNTNTAGTGTNYTAGSSYRNTSANDTLYAKWTINSYKLTINPDGGTYDGTTANTTVTQNYNTTYNFKADPTKTGYTFTGWTKVSGAGTFGTTAGNNTNVSASIKSDSTNGDYTQYKWLSHTASWGTLAYLSSLTLDTTHQYQLSYWAKSEVLTGGVITFGYRRNSDGNIQSATFPNASTWTKYNATFTPTSATGNLAIHYSAATTASTLDLKDVVLKDVTTGEIVYTTNKFTFGEGDATVKATWTPITYNIKFNPNGGTWNGSTSTTQATATYNSPYSLTTNPTRTGYNFTGWKLTYESGNANYASSSSDLTKAYTSVYTNKYGIVYANSLFGNIATYSCNLYNLCAVQGATATLTAQWSAKSSSVTAYAMRVAGSNITNDTVGGTVNVGDASATYGATSTYTCYYSNVYTVRAKAATGYKFDGWYRDSALTTEATDYVNEQGGLYENTYYYRRFYKQDANETIYAKFSPITYKIKFNPNGGTWNGSTSTTQATATYGSAYSLTTNPTRTGYNFTGWRLTYESGNANYASSSSDLTKAYTSVYTNKYGIVDANSLFGNIATYSCNLYNLCAVQGATATLTAQWSPKTYTITFNANGGLIPTNGNMGNSTVQSTYGTTLAADRKTGTVPVEYDNTRFSTMNGDNPTREGYTFTGWYTATSGGTKVYDATGVCTQEGTYFDSAKKWKYPDNVTLYAQWEANTYKLTVKPNGGTWTYDGTDHTTDVEMSVQCGKTVPVNPPTRPGYTFKNWTIEGEGSQLTEMGGSAKIFIMGHEDATLTANWTVATYDVLFRDSADGTSVVYYMNTANSTLTKIDDKLDIPVGTPTNLATEVYNANNMYPEKKDHVFKGWYKDKACTIPYGSNQTVTGADHNGDDERTVILYAGWRKIEDNLELNPKDPAYLNEKDTDKITGQSEFEMYGVQVRTTGEEYDANGKSIDGSGNGMRFCIRVSDALLNDLRALDDRNNTEYSVRHAMYGFVTANADMMTAYGATNKMITSTQPITGSYCFKKTNSVRNFLQANDYTVYTAVITGYNSSVTSNFKTKMETNIAIRPFIEYYDANGTMRTYYQTDSYCYNDAMKSLTMGGAYYTNLKKVSESIFVESNAKDIVKKNLFSLYLKPYYEQGGKSGYANANSITSYLSDWETCLRYLENYK